MMNAMVKRAMEIAGGVVIGLVANKLMDKVVKVAEVKLEDLKAKES